MNYSHTNDTYKHKGLRKQLVKELSEKGISDNNVLQAIENVPRHLFMENAFEQFAAYKDAAFQIGAGQTISQPYTVAFQSELLSVKKGDKVLEIGTGSGYQTCVLEELGARVFSIERQKSLFDKVRVFLPTLGSSAKFFYGDGYKGLPSFAPFDKIIVTAGAPFIPADLVNQLKTGGLMVIPVGDETGQTMTLISKISETETKKAEFTKFSFVPLLQDKAKERID